MKSEPQLEKLSERELAHYVAAENDLEKSVAAYQKASLNIGRALRDIRDKRLWRGKHLTWRLYLKQRWKMTKFTADRLIWAADDADGIEDLGIEE